MGMATDGSYIHSQALAEEATPQTVNAIFQPITLLSGRRVNNRLTKVAMYEHLASFGGGPPNSYHFRLYSEWAKHNWGIIITGNVAITHDHLTLGKDITLPASADVQSDAALLPFRELAKAIHGIYSDTGSTNHVNSNNTLAIMQLNHAGRQSANLIGGRPPFKSPLAPSSIRIAPSGTSLISRVLNNLMFQVPKAMSEIDVLEIVNHFVEGAILAYKAGFDGVQLHAAHGYLLAQFLSYKTNHRTDSYSADNALEVIHTISQRIRESTSSTFVICIKLNAAEYTSGANENDSLSEIEHRALEHLLTMATWGIFDFVEISGGDYEKPDFMMSETPSKTRRQAFFSSFSCQAVKALDDLQRRTSITPPLILLTGGLKNLELLSTALDHKHANLLGIGRGSVICPDLPSVIRERLKEPGLWNDKPFSRELDLSKPHVLTYALFSWIWSMFPNIQIIGAGVGMAWYVVTIREIASTGIGSVVNAHERGGLGSILWMWMPMAHYQTDMQKRVKRALLVFLACIAVTHCLHNVDGYCERFQICG